MPVRRSKSPSTPFVSRNWIEPAAVLDARNVTKLFAGVKVLDGVSLSIRPGEVHALMGENGAGKSTFMKIVAGQLAADSGTIELGGNRVAMIHQEFFHSSISPWLKTSAWVASRLGAFRAPSIVALCAPKRAPSSAGSVRKSIRIARCAAWASRGLQIVEIAKALARDAGVVLMDEPTSALAAHETELLFDVIRS